MHIAFKFHYTHDNGLFSRLLNHLRDIALLPVSLQQEGTHYTLYASGEQHELEAVAEQLSSLIPASLFLQSSVIEAVDEVRRASDPVETVTSYAIPFCPECQQKVTEGLDPFAACPVCGFSEISVQMDDLLASADLTAESSEALFSQLADRLIAEGELTLLTYNGVRHFALLGRSVSKDYGILCCNPLNISDAFVITQGELEALMMVEKPSVRLKPKLKFRSEHGLKAPFYPLFFADDKITLALTTALQRRGIEMLYCDHIPSLRCASALEKHFIVSTGRDMLPWSNPTLLAQPARCEYRGFEAIGGTNGVRLERGKQESKLPAVRYAAKEEEAADAIAFEPAHGAFRSVVLEHDLHGSPLCGVHLSRENGAQLFSFASKIGYTPMVLLNSQQLSQPRAMLESIAAMDESGRRLVENFKRGFPELSARIESLRFEQSESLPMIVKLWAMAAVFIGLYEGSDPLGACERLESVAIEFNGKSGPRIDYKVVSTDEGFELDPRLAIRSAMSFKLAGVDDYLLSFGFIDSLADFIALQAENADANIGIEGVAISGSLFENRQLLMRTYNAISSNYPIYRNERLAMDGANIAVGAITLGSE